MSIIYNNFSNALTAQDKSFAQPVCRKSHSFDTFTAVSKQPRTMNSGIERRIVECSLLWMMVLIRLWIFGSSRYTLCMQAFRINVKSEEKHSVVKNTSFGVSLFPIHSIRQSLFFPHLFIYFSHSFVSISLLLLARSTVCSIYFRRSVSFVECYNQPGCCCCNSPGRSMAYHCWFDVWIAGNIRRQQTT